MKKLINEEDVLDFVKEWEDQLYKELKKVRLIENHTYAYMYDHLDVLSKTTEFEAFETYEDTRALDGDPSIFEAVKAAFEALSPGDVYYEADYNDIDFWGDIPHVYFISQNDDSDFR